MWPSPISMSPVGILLYVLARRASLLTACTSIVSGTAVLAYDSLLMLPMEFQLVWKPLATCFYSRKASISSKPHTGTRWFATCLRLLEISSRCAMFSIGITYVICKLFPCELIRSLPIGQGFIIPSSPLKMHG